MTMTVDITLDLRFQRLSRGSTTIEMRTWRLMELFFLTPIGRNSQCEYNKQGQT